MQTKLLRCWWNAVWAVLVSVSVHAADAIPDEDCMQCHGDRDLTKETADGRSVSMFVDVAKLKASRHSTNTCWSCHSDIGAGHPDDGLAVKPVDCASCHREQSQTYGASVHGVALLRGEPGVATCKDCHGGHEVLPRSSPESLLNPAQQARICGGCHEKEAAEVTESVHGVALLQGKRDAPACTDCHSEHKIEQLRGAAPIRISERVCSQCHASERINARYRMPADRVKTFLGSYHGLAARLGSTRAANCASCHGVHSILPSSDPRSSIHPSNLVQTCGQCHPGATENFALGRIHTDLSTGDDIGSVVNRWVRRLYLGLIVVVVGLLASHNALHWWRKAAAARLASLAGEPRMDLGQRWQHLLLAVSFIILAWSGFALKFPDSWASWLLGADEGIRRWSHRVAALVLVGLGLFHLGYIFFTRNGRQLVRDFLPTRGDLTALTRMARYLRGKGPAPAHDGRFNYAEKIEYWAVAWGTIIMGVTGFMIWFPVATSHFLPRWAVDVATTIHYYEAILACLAIIVWHFYQVAFDPDVYPLNWSFWTGRKARSHKDPAAPCPPSSEPAKSKGTDAVPPDGRGRG
ncbi:MAG: cytochrome b/b6 domain-containing protein [Verrucomicrobia bacterium]|nr:cytochrome b/b6 domain-containing protein [Verrucomicrobiota bacterium]